MPHRRRSDNQNFREAELRFAGATLLKESAREGTLVPSRIRPNGRRARNAYLLESQVGDRIPSPQAGESGSPNQCVRRNVNRSNETLRLQRV